jgi:hypothetical protein
MGFISLEERVYFTTLRHRVIETRVETAAVRETSSINMIIFTQLFSPLLSDNKKNWWR